MTAKVIELRGLGRQYASAAGAVNVLEGLDLDVAPGEKLAIIGRSGSGKSTLLSILGCLDRPTAGLYRLCGASVAELSDDELASRRCQMIGFVFQSFHLLESRTVLENVELPMEYLGIPAAKRKERAEELIERVHLGHRQHARPSALSGGEKQRAAIARALVNSPSLLLADEPTGNLDLQSQREVLDMLEEIHEQTNQTMVLVTHDIGVSRLASRACLLSEGKLQEVDAASLAENGVLKR